VTTVLTVQTNPFPHVIADGWWPDDLLRAALAEFPDPEVPGWRRYVNSNERKLEGPPGLWGPRTREFYDLARDRGPQLRAAFGLPELSMETVGGGYHCIEPGGYLAVHTDFSRSPRTGRYRRLNLLVYLNDDWQDPGGHLELWNGGGKVVDITPEFNRTVVFETSSHSWHGHPLPAARLRRSLAAYYFTEQAPVGIPVADRSTTWHADAH